VEIPCFTASLQGTQRSESENAVLKKLVGKHSSLLQLWAAVKRIKDARERTP
jgi:hypothetical protein